MKTIIKKTDKYHWFAGSGRKIAITMTLEQAESVFHSGQCQDDVIALMQCPAILSQLKKIDHKELRDELKGYGAWDKEELCSHCNNLERILWLAGCDIAENPEFFAAE